VGGAPAQGVDFLARVYGTAPILGLGALALAFLLLRRAFRSWRLAVVAVGLDVLSVSVALGVMVSVFRSAWLTRALGLYRVGQIEGWVPIFIVAVLFGLSMDYEVFIVSRMRESYLSGRSSKDAIVDGLATTGAVVTAAALILTGALSGFVAGHVAGLQELGVGLAAGVLLDAAVVRALVLPALMALLGERAWR
jgi:RND superfamily putative drug exporter